MANGFIEQLKKYNPYHDSAGRFTSPNGGGIASFSLPKDPKYREKWKEREGKRVAEQESGKVTLSTGHSFNLPKLEGANAEEASKERAAAIDRVERFRRSAPKETQQANPNNYNQRFEAWATENTDPAYWAGMKGLSNFQTFKQMSRYKPNAVREEEARRRKERDSRNRALERAAQKRTPKYQELMAFEDQMRAKYSGQLGHTARSIFQVMNAEEGKRWDELRAATVQRQPNGQYRIAKSFGELIEKFNPYHDSRGRFTTAGAAASFTYSPGKSKAHDLAIAREKERTAEEKKRAMKEELERYAAFEKEMKAYHKEMIENAPELKGSEKQVAWAKDIRKRNLTRLFVGYGNEKRKVDLGQKISSIGEFGDPKKDVEFYAKVIEDLRAIPNAKYWIDNRRANLGWHYNRTLEQMGAPYRRDFDGNRITIEEYNKTGGK